MAKISLFQTFMENGTNYNKRRRNYSGSKSNSGESERGDGTEEESDEGVREEKIRFRDDRGRTYISVGTQTEATLDRSRRKRFGNVNPKGDGECTEIEDIMDVNKFTGFGDTLIQHFSQAGHLERKIIHDIVDVGPNDSIDSLLSKCISRAQTKQIERVIISSHQDGPKFHFHLIHDCPWNRRECKCFNVNVRPRNNAIHPSETWKTEDWCRLFKYLCQNGGWVNYCKSSEYEWVRRDGPIWTTEQSIHDRRSSDASERSAELSERGPLEIRSNQYFTCGERERHNIQSGSVVEQINRKSDHGESGSGSKRSWANAQEIEIFLKKYIVTPPENINTTEVWALNPRYKYILEKDDNFKRAIFAYKNQFLKATYT
uniref:Nonstructural protein 1 n=1 Tax=Luscinia sibilans parvoviridae sp. TaxID=2794516 RepID=A0A8A4XD71_9VIRU|nr:MAG: nonstructural protein 1 [Luscinia sibilans parvoviridae sp.]